LQEHSGKRHSCASLEKAHDAIEFPYPLLRIGNGNQGRFHTERLDDAPLRSIRVLELVENDKRIYSCLELSQPLSSMQELADARSEEVEANAPLLSRNAKSLVYSLNSSTIFSQ
jgi:hypothetical protein